MQRQFFHTDGKWNHCSGTLVELNVIVKMYCANRRSVYVSVEETIHNTIKRLRSFCKY
jgi:hypothetical protein